MPPPRRALSRRENDRTSQEYAPPLAAVRPSVPVPPAAWQGHRSQPTGPGGPCRTAPRRTKTKRGVMRDDRARTADGLLRTVPGGTESTWRTPTTQIYRSGATTGTRTRYRGPRSGPGGAAPCPLFLTFPASELVGQGRGGGTHPPPVRHVGLLPGSRGSVQQWRPSSRACGYASAPVHFSDLTDA